jgi:N utilization substance protein B
MKNISREEKRITRYICLQLLYSTELSNQNKIGDLLKNFFKGENALFDNISKEQVDYIKKLYKTTIDNKEKVDAIIIKKLNNWDITRLAAIDKAILRMSISEMLFIDEVPPKVSITEGVEIAKVFSTDDSSSFVNGILDTVYNKIYKK